MTFKRILIKKGAIKFHAKFFTRKKIQSHSKCHKTEELFQSFVSISLQLEPLHSKVYYKHTYPIHTSPITKFYDHSIAHVWIKLWGEKKTGNLINKAYGESDYIWKFEGTITSLNSSKIHYNLIIRSSSQSIKPYPNHHEIRL